MMATGSVRGKCSVLQAGQARFQPASAIWVASPQLAQKLWRLCQSRIAFAVPAMARSAISMMPAATRRSSVSPRPCNGPSFQSNLAGRVVAKVARPLSSKPIKIGSGLDFGRKAARLVLAKRRSFRAPVDCESWIRTGFPSWIKIKSVSG